MKGLRFILLLASVMFSMTGMADVRESGTWWEIAVKAAEHDGYRVIRLDEAKKRMKSGTDIRIIDVRPDYEFDTGHLPGAVNFEIDLGDRMVMSTERKNTFSQVLGRDKGRPIILYCRSYA